ncbi:MAG: UDP-N-acetylmuramyl peptide synthase [Methanobacteriaceae archaeon]|jgi:UDP-N-acetylmuramate--alanine ligase/UDP-N-acetylmuramoyl-L-alanyl-D-glutamate--2,6-diaminopimelate ligase|nr:UDP-N-acetylmuramyl peptide synthase [Candidatus Methanorudis spinitermitis]
MNKHNENKFTIKSLAKDISGTIVGAKDFNSKNGFSGIFNVLSDSKEGDIVIRHWINEEGIKIANKNNIACLITENPQGNSVNKAKDLNFPIIIVDKIEIANAFALKWTINKFVSNSKKVVVSGTNGKSTTTHVIYHILKCSGANTFTNTDSKSEYNTLIDPMISKLISDYVLNHNYSKLDYLIIEVSEVQGWLDKQMKNHAYLLTDAINPDSVVITNVAMDHIGLVNSIEEVFEETSGVVKALNKGIALLNYDDTLVRSMRNSTKKGIEIFFFSINNHEEFVDNPKLLRNKLLIFDPIKEAIVYENSTILTLDELPFKSNHFIQNIVAAVAACISLNVPVEYIVKGIKSYKPLKRRFSRILNKPLIIDDFAHNPDGIKATVNAVCDLAGDNEDNIVWIVCAIRGSRGEEINKLNAESLANVILKIKNNSLNKTNIKIILSSSNDVVDNANIVKDFEREIFENILNKNDISFTHYSNLEEALNNTYNLANKEDIILLIGAQGMDPAASLLLNII